MHPATEFQLQFFETSRLHPALRPVVEDFAALALRIARGPENAETTRALEDLIAAKDHACRAIVADGRLKPQITGPAVTGPDETGPNVR